MLSIRLSASSDELCARTLEILLYDATPSAVGRDDECSGQVLLPLDDVDLSTADTVWLCKGVSPHVKRNEVGTQRSPYKERECADTVGTVLVPWAGHFQC